MAIHYTCDLCRNAISGEKDVRYEVNIEVKAAFEAHPACCGADLDLDYDLHDEMNELIDLMEELDGDDVEGGVYKVFRFDLCNECRKKYMKDPLFRRSMRRMGFSEN